MDVEPGLRERKKQRTRRAIREAALRLFAERSFEAVTVVEVAKEADVSPATVFNYFPTKEDLFYGEMESFEAQLLATIRERPSGETALVAFRRFVLEFSGVLAEEDPGERLSMFARIVTTSPSLQERERQIFARYTESLASLLADETGAPVEDIRPWVAANALMGVHRGLVEYVRRQALDGRRGPGLQADVRAQGEQAFDQLERGLGNYAIKR